MPVEVHRVALVGGGSARVLMTGRADGDLRVDGPSAALDRRRAALVHHPWVWLRQVHGAEVVDGDQDAAVGARADAVVITAAERVATVHTADCAPVALVAPETGVVAAVHAGWRGLVGGVIEAAVVALERHGPSPVVARIGPCICARCYEFGEEDATRVSARYGPQVRARSRRGAPALDLRAGVRAALAGAGVGDVTVSPHCTACGPASLFSHRARADRGRQALLVWREGQEGS